TRGPCQGWRQCSMSYGRSIYTARPSVYLKAVIRRRSLAPAPRQIGDVDRLGVPDHPVRGSPERPHGVLELGGSLTDHLGLPRAAALQGLHDGRETPGLGPEAGDDHFDTPNDPRP